ncbi:Vms1/Ankzf1 family peptidyl-tRNA hydrolase [Phytoactinopolyspora mesophila]|uniref:Peptide chain release factor 1 n=1 Tax=Phytoactinopolyspora mesophila TaxID=2650750 RepID=A0A7K3MBN4_9ACTN|nr:Vms1/Ankzf1 family peptidyl-tRNA hydrolase [Phytoactinopolyspora mesophila]NDL60731.1 hypothetical protein [Phytoactinopolyspora mesophila]
MSSNKPTTMALVSDLCQNPGPFLSAYLDVSRNIDEAPHRLAVRWHSAAEELLRSGAPADLVQLAGERMQTPVSAPGNVARMIVAADDQILLDDVVQRPHSPEVVTWSPLPDVTGWLADRSGLMPVLIVLADREGADFEFYDPWPERLVNRDTAAGDTEHLTKVSAGGWSHKRYQRRAEETWRRNAEQVAEEIDHLVKAGVRVVAVAGDLRAQSEIRQAVSEATRSVLADLETGGRAAGSSRQALDDAVDHMVREIVVADHRRVLDEFEQELGRSGAAVRGVGEVLQKLIHGQVRTVLLSPEIAAAHEVSPSAYPGISLPSKAFDYERVRADLAVTCAAAATDAELIVAPSTITEDGVAAVLRW